MITISYFWMNAHVVALITSPPMSSFFEEWLEPSSSITAMVKMVLMALRDMVTAMVEMVIMVPHGVERHGHSHGVDGHHGAHGVETHGNRHHAEQIKVVTDPEERSSRLPPTGLASSWIAANEKVKNKRTILTFFYKPFQARHRLQVIGWVSGWCRCLSGMH